MKKTTFILLNSAALLAGTTLAHAATLVADYQFEGNYENSVKGTEAIGGTLTEYHRSTAPSFVSGEDGQCVKFGESCYSYLSTDMSSVGESWAMSLDVYNVGRTSSASGIITLGSGLTLMCGNNKSGWGSWGLSGTGSAFGGGRTMISDAAKLNDWVNLSLIYMDGGIHLYVDQVDVTSQLAPTTLDSLEKSLGTIKLGWSAGDYGVTKGSMFDNLKFYSVDAGDTLSSVERTVVGIVPEPSSFGLLAGAGVLALAVARRRRPCRKS